MPEDQPIEYRGYLLVYEPGNVPCAPGGSQMLWTIKRPDGTNVTLPGDKAPAMGFPTTESAKQTIDVMEDLRAEGHPVTFETVSWHWAQLQGLGDAPDRQS